jgi:alanyl-tRNA synthetase
VGVKVFPPAEAFKLRDTYGIPFDVVFEGLHSQWAVVDWRSLVEVCVAHGWNRKAATAQIVDAVRDVYPQDRVEFIKWADGPGSHKEE